jgi:hypothetical protein
LLAAGIAVGGAGAARACIGDCNGDGVVAVPELIVGVRISLGEAPLSDCPAFAVGPGSVVDITALVTAVAAALDGCPATPTATVAGTPSSRASATPTATPTSTSMSTPTPTLTPTVTVTPTVPDVSGRWREDPLAVTASTCGALTEGFAADLAAQPPCEQSVEVSSATTATLVDCTGTRVDGTLDRAGTLQFK